MARRGSQYDCMGRRRGFSSNNCFTGIIYCAECGEPFRRVHWNNHGCKSIVWRCTSRLDKKGECHARTIYENGLKSAFTDALNQLIDGSSGFLPILQENIRSVLLAGESESSEHIQSQIDDLQAQLLLKANNHEDYSEIAKEIFDLRDQQEKSQLNDNSRSEYIKRINDLQKFIISQTKTITDFDEKLVKHLLDKVTVYESKLVFEFKSGISITIDK